MSADPLAMEFLVRGLARPEGRQVGSSGHATAEAWCRQQLQQLQLLPYAGQSLDLPYTRENLNFLNFAGVIPGADRDLPPLLIGAHYDSAIPAASADDNASAVACVLEAARQLSEGPRLPRDLVVALFDAEEPPYFHTSSMGSTRFYEDHRDPRGFHAALILDLVGHDVGFDFGDSVMPLRIRQALFVLGAESHPELAALVEASNSERLTIAPALNDYVGDMSDHHVFNLHGVPFLFFSCGQWEHYHEPTDTPDRLNYTKLAAVADLLADWTGAVAWLPLAADAPRDGDFTLAMEIAGIRRLLGPFEQPLMDRLGLGPMDCRETLDGLIRTLIYRLAR
jgi:hypothetical protein